MAAKVDASVTRPCVSCSDKGFLGCFGIRLNGRTREYRFRRSVCSSLSCWSWSNLTHLAVIEWLRNLEKSVFRFFSEWVSMLKNT